MSAGNSQTDVIVKCLFSWRGKIHSSGSVYRRVMQQSNQIDWNFDHRSTSSPIKTCLYFEITTVCLMLAASTKIQRMKRISPLSGSGNILKNKKQEHGADSLPDVSLNVTVDPTTCCDWILSTKTEPQLQMSLVNSRLCNKCTYIIYVHKGKQLAPNVTW